VRPCYIHTAETLVVMESNENLRWVLQDRGCKFSAVVYTIKDVFIIRHEPVQRCMLHQKLYVYFDAGCDNCK